MLLTAGEHQNLFYEMLANETAVVILAHGSPNEGDVVGLMGDIVRRVKAGLTSGVEVEWAALQFNHPNLGEAVENLVKRGAKRLVVMPYFLFGGRHSTRDIPNLIEDIKQAYPHIEFISTSTLGMDGLLADLVIKRIQETAPELLCCHDASVMPHTPEHINSLSMEIIESLLPPLECSDEERWLIKRIVHAAGDAELPHLVKFHSQAVSHGIDAIRKGRPIFTDVKMVATGISHQLSDKFGCSINCAVDEPEVIRQAQEGSITRAAAAMRYLGNELNDAIIAIGNAPTALFALLDLVDSGDVLPAVIVGMPVGFVGAKESKVELVKRSVPYVTVEGNRGGSTLAVATVNALLSLA